ncbi:protocatechuate 3,4-dioxygenase [Rhizobacter sp. Root1221]|nr:protocatechuate 3,4-dioxygenase [Rhizobacter sp. Root1221]
MKRRELIFSAGGLFATGAIGAVPQAPAWSMSGLRTGGTAGMPTELPAPRFRAEPQCVVMRDKTLGPCHTNDVPIRRDVTAGVTGLPMWVSLRVVDAIGCKPVAGADIEIWHADVRGIYSGRAAALCNPDDAAAKRAGFLRGRQVTDAGGVVSFLTIYPGWYGGRAPHVHLRVLVERRELLISQLLFDEALNDAVYGNHPDYAKRTRHDTLNRNDFAFSASEVERFTFDVEKLGSGVLQASYTIGLTRRRP